MNKENPRTYTAAQRSLSQGLYVEKGATENGWFESDAGKKSVDNYAKICYQTNKMQNSIKICSIR